MAIVLTPFAGLDLVYAAAEPHATPHSNQTPFRGVHFNPQVRADMPDFPWLLFYPEHRETVRRALEELVREARVNFIDIFVMIPHTLAKSAVGPQAGQTLAEWANIAYLDNVAAFIDDCHAAGISLEIDLACNLWIPHSVDSEHHLSNSGHWPKADDTPWDEAATWYSEVIEYVEAHTAHPESIAMWSMMGNHEFGAAEPVLWDREDLPAVTTSTEQFVKRVWPVFRAAGKRPKASPIMLPIFSANPYWSARPPLARLSAFSNLKKWLVDDLALPPDYWVMTTYPFCDPAPDGFHYLRAILKILGPESAGRLVSTDFKWFDREPKDSILAPQGKSGADVLEWHFKKCAEYGFSGWWIWAYQDCGKEAFGLRGATGEWRQELLPAIRVQYPPSTKP
ncbi:MAG: hypothetical protein WC655_01970 [Candidatus Hydrogenedentales bacterium]